MKLNELKFDNGNNACASLHMIAELARRGDVKVVEDKPHPKIAAIEDGNTIWLMVTKNGR